VIEVPLLALGVRRVSDELSIHPTYPDRPNRPGEWDIGNAKRRRCAVDCEHIWIILSVCAEQNADDLRVVKISLRKKRSERAVNHARRERFLFGGATFAFEITSRKFADGGRLFAVIDRQREIILTFFNGGGGDSASQHHGVAA